MYPNPYQNQYQYPNQFGGFQNHIIEPPMPTNHKKGGSGGGFWLGFLGGIILSVILFVSLEVFKRIKASSKHVQIPPQDPNTEKTIKAETTVKTIPEEIPSVFAISKPHETQTFDQFLNYLQTLGFYVDDDASDVTKKEVWQDGDGNFIHFSNTDFTVKTLDNRSETFTKKEALFVRFNDTFLNFINDDGE